jgi:hypothetical protein
MEAIQMEAMFQTTDSDLAAYLFARAYTPVETQNGSGKTTFVFPREAELSAEAFYHGAPISAKNLLYAVHQLELLRREY